MTNYLHCLSKVEIELYPLSPALAYNSRLLTPCPTRLMSQGMEQKAAKSLAAGAQRFGTLGVWSKVNLLTKRDTVRSYRRRRLFVAAPIFLSKQTADPSLLKKVCEARQGVRSEALPTPEHWLSRGIFLSLLHYIVHIETGNFF